MTRVANPVTAIAVTIAGSDSGGGAGIQADLKTFSALGVYGASVIAALTAQNTRGVSAVLEVPPAFVTAQMDAVFSDLAVGAVKIGMLGNAGVVEAVAAGLARHRHIPIVLDPVMVATSGDRLLMPDAVEALRTQLVPLALVVTPNLPEAAALLDAPQAATEDEMVRQAERLLALGAKAVLMKGGHGKSRGERRSPGHRGCHRALCRRPYRDGGTPMAPAARLAAAIAAGLAKGEDLAAAVRTAKDYVTAAIAAADRLAVGHGHGPVHHFHRWW